MMGISRHLYNVAIYHYATFFILQIRKELFRSSVNTTKNKYHSIPICYIYDQNDEIVTTTPPLLYAIT